MGEDRVLKANFLLKITNFEKTGEDEDGKAQVKLKDEKWVKAKAKELEKSLYEDRRNGIERKVAYVRSVPTNFQFGVLYIREDGKMAWIYNLTN